MRKIKKPKIGEYVLVTKYADKDPYDPWCISFVEEIIENKDGFRYKVEGNKRLWKNVYRITKEEGAEWVEFFKGWT